VVSEQILNNYSTLRYSNKSTVTSLLRAIIRQVSQPPSYPHAIDDLYVVLEHKQTPLFAAGQDYVACYTTACGTLLGRLRDDKGWSALNGKSPSHSYLTNKC
jgi:hypothetical protein